MGALISCKSVERGRRQRCEVGRPAAVSQGLAGSARTAVGSRIAGNALQQGGESDQVQPVGSVEGVRVWPRAAEWSRSRARERRARQAARRRRSSGGIEGRSRGAASREQAMVVRDRSPDVLEPTWLRRQRAVDEHDHRDPEDAPDLRVRICDSAGCCRFGHFPEQARLLGHAVSSRSLPINDRNPPPRHRTHGAADSPPRPSARYASSSGSKPPRLSRPPPGRPARRPARRCAPRRRRSRETR